MAYSAEISRTNPSCFLFLIDQSGSMADLYVSVKESKSKAVADVINRILQQLVIKCAKSDGIRNYYHVGVIGYGADGVGPAFLGNLSKKNLVPISEVADNPARIEERTKNVPDGAGGLVPMTIKFPIWFDPIENGGTPMTEAFSKANAIISDWLSINPNCFPPVIINITDGESTDGDPLPEMIRLTNQSSNDGNVILFNLHTNEKALNSLSFPGYETILPDKNAEILFKGSSPLPKFISDVAIKEYNMSLSDSSRAFVMNGDLDIIIRAVEIGTRASLQLLR